MERQLFTLQILDYLTSPQGSQALALAETLDPGSPGDVTKLRKLCTPEQSRAVLEIIDLRRRARGKFSRAEQMFFDRKGYEQSSGEVLAEYKAQRVKLFNQNGTIWDLCCGIGGDTLALAVAGPVTAVDSSPIRISMADLNLRAYHRRERANLVCGDVGMIDLPTEGFFHLDPDQRASERRRTFNLDELVPGREFIDRLVRTVRNGIIKFSPATEYADLPWEGTVELISHKGQCRQLLLWTGSPADVKLKATALPSGAAITDEMPEAFNVSPIQKYLYDPDPAVSRLRLLGQLAAELGLNFLGPGQIVLTGDHLVDHPQARAFAVEDVFPYHDDKAKKYFRQAGFGTVTVKPRGVQVDVDRLSKLFSGKGEADKVLFLLRLDKKVLAAVGTEKL